MGLCANYETIAEPPAGRSATAQAAAPAPKRHNWPLTTFVCGVILTAVPMMALWTEAVDHCHALAVHGGAADYDPEHIFYWLRK